MKVNMSLGGHKTTIPGCYAVNDALINTKEEFFEVLNEELTKIGTSREIILMGDLNSRVERRAYHKAIRKFGDETINDNGNRM